MEGMEHKEGRHFSRERATREDIPVLIEIEKSVEKTKTYSPMDTEKEWEEELETCTVYILKEGNIPVGSIAYEEKSLDHIYISGIIVRPEFQGKGIATRAIKEVLDTYPTASRIDLVTHPENSALKLYESLGFKVESRKENYFGDGEPRLVLVLSR